MNAHPELVAEAIDILASADEPWATTELARRLTTTMHRRVQRGDFDMLAVMTYNDKPGRCYYEVTAATVAGILDRRDDVVMTGKQRVYGGRRKCYALKSNVERWQRDEQRSADAAVAADTRYRIEPYAGQIRVMDTQHPQTVAWIPVATFNVETLGSEYAVEAAEKVKRHLIVAAAKAAKAEAVHG